MVVVTVDPKYRVTIPKEVRAGIKPGDVLVVVQEEQDGATVLRYARVENPFDALARAAIAEYRAGETRNLRDVAAELGIELNAAR